MSGTERPSLDIAYAVGITEGIRMYVFIGRRRGQKKIEKKKKNFERVIKIGGKF